MEAKTVEKTKKAKAVEVLVDAHVRVEFDRWLIGRSKVEEKAKKLEKLAEEFMDFVRDHRHQDSTDMFVEREHQWQCSLCKNEWNTHYDNDGVLRCSHCGAEVAGGKK